MMRDRHCESCANRYTPRSSTARYCSPACKEAARKARRPRPPAPVGNRREGFAVVIDGVPGVWRPKYLSEDRDRLPTASPEDLSSMPGRYDGSKSKGQVDRRCVALARDAARQWALETHGVDIGAGL